MRPVQCYVVFMCFMKIGAGKGILSLREKINWDSSMYIQICCKAIVAFLWDFAL